MTLDEIRTSDKMMLTPADISEVLGTDPQSVRTQAQEDPAKLGFAVTVIGRSVRIPRISFLYWLQYGNAVVVSR